MIIAPHECLEITGHSDKTYAMTSEALLFFLNDDEYARWFANHLDKRLNFLQSTYNEHGLREFSV